MPPITRRGAEYLPAYNCSGANIDPTSTSASETNTHEDMQALMYIVCVLLFYSLGIVVGIITYLKREKQEIEESKMFDEFVTIINNNRQPNYRLIKVQEVIQRLNELQSSKIPLPQPQYSKTVPRKNSYTAVLPPLGVSDCTNGNYETIYNEAMDVIPKEEDNEGPHEDGYQSDTDPFQNKRLSQVVAQILDNNPDIGTGDDYSQFDDSEYSDDSLSTDFIHYNEEPKNKELFRAQLKGIEEFDNESGQDSGISRIIPKDDYFPSPPCVKDLEIEHVSSDDNNVASSISTTTTHDDVFTSEKFETESPKQERAADGTGFRWSVTSV